MDFIIINYLGQNWNVQSQAILYYDSLQRKMDAYAIQLKFFLDKKYPVNKSSGCDCFAKENALKQTNELEYGVFICIYGF